MIDTTSAPPLDLAVSLIPISEPDPEARPGATDGAEHATGHGGGRRGTGAGTRGDGSDPGENQGEGRDRSNRQSQARGGDPQVRRRAEGARDGPPSLVVVADEDAADTGGSFPVATGGRTITLTCERFEGERSLDELGELVTACAR